MTLELTDVTLCAADCLHPTLAARALSRSMEQCTFGDAVLFSDVSPPGLFRTVKIPTLRSRADYSHFVLKALSAHISTAYALIVQWDGYVLARGAWRAEFKNYDYVGAPWPWHADGMNVGNGGFSLRSRRLLDITARSEFGPLENQNEDELICRLNRCRLEQQHGIQIAPLKVAEAFAYERGVPAAQTFGFHGLFNLWRHVTDATMMDIAGTLGPQVLRSREFIELLFQYMALRKFTPAMCLFARLRESMSPQDIQALAQQSLGNATLAQRLIHECQQMMAAA